MNSFTVQPTSISLLDLLQRDNDADAWRKMLFIYQPLIEKWLVRFGAPKNDLHDLSQNILTVIVRKIPEFEHGGRVGSFRAWVRTITRNCLLEFWRAKKIHPIATGDTSFQDRLNQLADEASQLSQQWNREHDEHVLAAVLKQIQPEFKEGTWKAFQKVVIQQESPADVAKELGVTVNSVFIAKSRVLARIRTAGKYLVD